MAFREDLMTAGRKLLGQTPAIEPIAQPATAAQQGASALFSATQPVQPAQDPAGTGNLAAPIIQPIKPIVAQEVAPIVSPDIEKPVEDKKATMYQEPIAMQAPRKEELARSAKDAWEYGKDIVKSIGSIGGNRREKQFLDQQTAQDVASTDLFSFYPSANREHAGAIGAGFFNTIGNWIKPGVEGVDKDRAPEGLLDNLKTYEQKLAQLNYDTNKRRNDQLTPEDRSVYAQQVDQLKQDYFGQYVKDPAKIDLAIDELKKIYNKSLLKQDTLTSTFYSDELKEQQVEQTKNAQGLFAEDPMKQVTTVYQSAYQTAGGDIGNPMYSQLASYNLQTINQQVQEAIDVIGKKQNLTDDEKQSFWNGYMDLVNQEARLTATSAAFHNVTDPEKLKEKDKLLEKVYGTELKFDKDNSVYYNFTPIGKDDKLESYLKGVNEYAFNKGGDMQDISLFNKVKDIATNTIAYGYRRTLEPVVNTMNFMVKGDAANKDYIVAQLNNALDPNYDWNSNATFGKRLAEVGIDLVVLRNATKAMENLLGKGLGMLPLGSKAALPISMAGNFGINTVGSSIVNGMILANFPTAGMNTNDYNIDTFFDGITALGEGLRMAKGMRAVDNTFQRNQFLYPELYELGVGTKLTTKQAFDINNSIPVYSNLIKQLYRDNPTVTTQLLKDSMFKTQMIKFINTELVPAYRESLKVNGGNINKAIEDAQKYYNDNFKTTAEAKEAAVKDPASTVQDVAEAGETTLVNSRHDQPSTTKVQQGTVVKTGDPVQDLLNDIDNTTTKTYTSFNDDLKVSTSDLKPAILAKVDKIYANDPNKEKLTSIINYRNQNGETIMFVGDKPTQTFQSFVNTKGISLDDTVVYLAKVDQNIALSNATNNSAAMVGKQSYDNVHFVKASEEEITNPEVPKFKIDGSRVVPMQATDAEMVKGKKWHGKQADFTVDADKIATTNVEGVTYVTSPIETLKPIKSKTINKAKLTGDDGQKIYLDYRKKVEGITPRKQELSAMVNTDDLYAKLFKQVDGVSDLVKHIKVSKILDNIIDTQSDAKALLNLIKDMTDGQVTKFVGYFESLDPVARSIFLNDYQGAYKQVVDVIKGDGFDHQDIALQNFVADLLVANGTYATKDEAQSMLRKYKDEFLASLVNGIKKQDEQTLQYTKAVLPIGFKFNPATREVLDPVTQYLNDPKLLKIRNDVKGEFTTEETKLLPDNTAGAIDFRNKKILINAYMAFQKPAAFAAEFSHLIYHYLPDNLRKEVAKMYDEYLDTAIKGLSKERKIPLQEAETILRNPDAHLEKGHKDYLKGTYYPALSVEEFFSENLGDAMISGVHPKQKLLRRIIDNIIKFFKELYNRLSHEKQFKDLLDNLDEVLLKDVDIKDQDVLFTLKKKVSIDFTTNTNKTITISDISKEDQTILHNVNNAIAAYIEQVGAGDSTSILNFLDMLEKKIDSLYSLGSPEYDTATTVVNSYYRSLFNGTSRNLVDIEMSKSLQESVTKPLTQEAITSELETVMPEIRVMLTDMEFNPSDFNAQVNDEILNAANKLKDKDIDAALLKDTKIKIKNTIKEQAVSQGLKGRKIDEAKLNDVLDVVAMNNLNIKGAIKTVDFNDINAADYSLGLKKSFVKEIYGAAFSENQIRLPLPASTTQMKVEYDWKDKRGPVHNKVWNLYNDLAKTTPAGGTVYVFTNDYYVAKRRDSIIKKPKFNVIFVTSKINNVGLRTEDNMLFIESDNIDVFNQVQQQLSDVISFGDDPIKANAGWIVQQKANITPMILEYLKNFGADAKTVKELAGKPLVYWKNLVASKRAYYNGLYSYDFVDINTMRDELKNVFAPKQLDTFAVDKGLVYSINEQYGFALDEKKFELRGRLKDIAFDQLLRAYVSPTQSEKGRNEINFLYHFMDTTNNQAMRDRNEYKRGLSMRGIDLKNPTTKAVIKDIVFENFLNSDLSKPLANYILTMSEVTDTLLDDLPKYKQLENDMLQEKRYKKGAGMDPATFYEGKIDSQLGMFLLEYYKLNETSLNGRFNKFIKNTADENVDMGEVLDEQLTIHAPKFASDTVKKGTALAYINSVIEDVMNNQDAINTKMMFNKQEPLSNGYYLVNRQIQNYINNIFPINIDGTIEKFNFVRKLEEPRVPLLANTAKYFKGLEELLDGFFENKINARRNLSGSGRDPFVKKLSIDNLFGEISYQLRGYTKSLEKTFGGHPETFKIISGMRENLFKLDRFGSATEENYLFLKKDFAKIRKDIVDGHNKILDILKTASNSIDFTMLMRTGKTVKLGKGKDMLEHEMLLFDSYTLGDFLKFESENLGYNLSDQILKSESAIMQQVTLVGMYLEEIQKMVDDASVGDNSYSSLFSNYQKDLKLKNPIYINGGLDLEHLPNIQEQAKKFFKGDMVTRINMYNSLFKNTTTVATLKGLFEKLSVDIDMQAIKAIDYTTKSMITALSEAFIKSGYREKFAKRSADSEKISSRFATYSFFSSIESILDKATAEKVVEGFSNITEDLKTYMQQIGMNVDYYLSIGSRSNIDSASVIKKLYDNNKKFNYVMTRLDGIINALKDLGRHEVVTKIGQDYKINIMGDEFKFVDILQDNKWKALYDLKIGKVSEDFYNEVAHGIEVDNKEFGTRGYDVDETLEDIKADGLSQVYGKRKELLDEFGDPIEGNTPKERLEKMINNDAEKFNFQKMIGNKGWDKLDTTEKINEQLYKNIDIILKKKGLVDYYNFGDFVKLNEIKNPIYEPSMMPIPMKEDTTLYEELAMTATKGKITQGDIARMELALVDEVDEAAKNVILKSVDEDMLRSNELGDFISKCFE